METYNGLSFEKITKNDIQSLKETMKRAYSEDSKRHLGDESGAPVGYDDENFARRWYFYEDAYKVLKADILIGGVNVLINDSNENYLGNIFIDPLYQDRGFGAIIWNYIEQKYPKTKKWRTETPGFSKRNHNFYIHKCGFKLVRIDNPNDKFIETYIFEKEK